MCGSVRFKSRLKMREFVMYFAIAFLGFANSEESFVNVMASDRRVLDSETSEVFNKTLASKDSSKFLRGARTPPTPPTRVVPSYSPPNR